MSAHTPQHEQQPEWWRLRAGHGVRAAARIVGVSQNHLYKQISSGKVRTVRVGCKIIVPTDEITRLMAGAPPRVFTTHRGAS
jgi:hypothetical protein